MRAAVSTPAPADTVQAFDGFLASRMTEPSSFQLLRRRAMDRFAELGLPTPRREEWRFTNLSPLKNIELTPVGEPAPVPDEAAGRWPFSPARRLVFVDGRFARRLSSPLNSLPPGLTITSLVHALERHPARVEAHLAHVAQLDGHPFIALNTAFHCDGAFVELAPGTVLDQPLHLLYLSTSSALQRAVFPRTLIVAGEASQAMVVETFVGVVGHSLTCPVTEVVLGQGAVLEHTRIQDEHLETVHLGTLAATLDRDARFEAHAFSLGGALVRSDVNVVLDGEGAHADLSGLYLVTGTQHVDTALKVRHARPHGSSRELYKGILDGRGRAAFTGRIVVDPGAQKTDAIQSNRNLLLSDEATVNSNPQLEILADDVRCTHGSTVGRLDRDALFYLRTRGLDLDAARSLLTWAFAREVVDRVRFLPLRAALATAVLDRLPGGHRLEETV